MITELAPSKTTHIVAGYNTIVRWTIKLSLNSSFVYFLYAIHSPIKLEL